MIKYWTLDQNKATLTNKISVRSSISAAEVNHLLNLLVLISASGSIFLINANVI
jgi:hypothetical protein